MANNRIQIKRSATTATPTSLNPGELAFSNVTGGSGVLFIGSTDGGTVVPIGGVRSPGILTANQALVANTTSGINSIQVGNVVMVGTNQSINANGDVGTAGHVLFSGGTGSNAYWASAGGLGVNTAAQYVWSNTQTFQNTISFSSTINIAANAVINSTAYYWVGNTTTSPTVALANTGSFTIGNSSTTQTTSIISIANSVGSANITPVGFFGNGINITTINATNITTGTLPYAQIPTNVVNTTGSFTLSGNTTLAGTNTVISSNLTVSGANLNVSGTNTSISSNVNIIGSTVAVSANITATGTFINSSGTINAAAHTVGTNFIANSSQLTISGTPVSANGGVGSQGQALFSNGASGSPYWADVGDITAVTAGSGLTGGGTSGAVTLDVGAGNAISVSADTVAVKIGTNLIFDGNANVATSSNVTFSNIVTTDITVNGNTKLGDTTADVISINGYVNTNITPSANVTYDLGTNALRWREIHASNVHSVVGYFDGNVEIGGNLVVVGNVTTTNVQSVIISDPMIYLAGNNYVSDLVDIGFSGNYYDGSTQRHTGFFRDATDGIYRLFANSTQELSGNNTVDTAAVGYVTASLVAYLQAGGLVSNATSVYITANSTVNVNISANTLSLSGRANNDLLFSNGTGGLTGLALGTSGYVVQSNGSAIVYDTLDGGTF